MGSISEPPSLFSNLPSIPPDEPFSVNAAYIKDTHPKKVNLGIGVYRTSEGNPWPLRVVEDAEKSIYHARNPSRHEYLSIQGDQEFLHLAADLVFDFDSSSSSSSSSTSTAGIAAIKERVTSIQTISGTGANRLGAEFLSRTIHPSPSKVWIPSPTWSNHQTIWSLTGVPQRPYPYYDSARKEFNYTDTISALSTASKNDIVILHACAHNPTGSDPSREQWEGILRICQERGLIPFFDLAYQGFASGDVGKDAWAVRRFFEAGIEFVVAQSFSKNFGLYGQRVGALHVVSSPLSSETKGEGGDVLAMLCHLVRGEYSMAPRGGAEIVRTVLGDAELREKWVEDLGEMSRRILRMRKALYEGLVGLRTPGDWGHILRQIGMFTYVGLSENQVFAIRERHHIYMLKSGRISISGLNESNVEYVAMAIDDVVRTVC